MQDNLHVRITSGGIRHFGLWPADKYSGTINEAAPAGQEIAAGLQL
jgi:hypothetical protein